MPTTASISTRAQAATGIRKSLRYDISMSVAGNPGFADGCLCIGTTTGATPAVYEDLNNGQNDSFPNAQRFAVNQAPDTTYNQQASWLAFDLTGQTVGQHLWLAFSATTDPTGATLVSPVDLGVLAA